MGVDDIYALDMSSGELRKATDARFGAFEPSVDMDHRRMAWSDYTNKGYNIAVKEIDPSHFETFDPLAPIKEQPFFSYHDQAARKQAAFIPPRTDSIFESKDYSRAGHLFHFHSWSPFWFDYTDPNIDNPTVSPGITLLSQNILSTAVTSLGYEYRNGQSFLHTNFIYKGWFPVLDFSMTYGGFPTVNAIKEAPKLPLKVNSVSYLQS